MPFLTIFLVALVLVAFIAGIFTFRHFQGRYQRRMQSPPTSDTFNTTNYTMLSKNPEDLADLSPEEARILLEKWKAAGHIPAHRDFFQVQRILEKAEEDKEE